MNNEERQLFYDKEGKAYKPQAIEEFGEFCIQYPYKQDMPRYQFTIQHLIAMNLQRQGAGPNRYLRKLKVLDIGCQNGAFDVGMANLGFDVTAVDLSDDYLEITNNSLKKFSWHDAWRVVKADINGDISEIMKLKNFDVIVALEVVEHLPDLENFFTAVSALAFAKSSKLIINVPGGDSWKSDPGHLLSFFQADELWLPDTHRTMHVVPECFERDGWKILDCQKHVWDEENYWYAIALER